MYKDCVICTNPNRNSNNIIKDKLVFDCPRCGAYNLDKDLADDIKNKKLTEEEIIKLSSSIRNNPDLITSYQVFERYRQIPMIDIYEKADNLLKWIKERTKSPGTAVGVDVQNPRFLAICWAHDDKEIRYLAEYLVGKGLLQRSKDNNIALILTVTFAGYTYLDNRQKNKNSNIGFCAMSFDDSLSHIWEEAISPAILEAGYTPKRVDEQPHNEGVVDQIISLIRISKFIVADITSHRNGVYFEAGFAKGFGLEVIFTCREDDFKNKAHFDVQHYNFLLWKNNGLEDYKKRLRFRIEETLGRGTG